jgi:hypothetical protein
MWGATQGTGKSLLGETLLRVYGSNGICIGQQELTSPFNTWAQQKQFIMGDEITGNDSRAHADMLKGLITGHKLLINEKYVSAYELPNFINFYFTSNHPDAFFIENADRRFLVLEAPNYTLEQAFYNDYDQWMRSGEGPAAVLHYLLQVPLEGFAPRAAAPRTAARISMTESSRSDVGRFDDPRKESRTTVKAISMELQRQGAFKALNGRQILTATGNRRFYVVRSLEQWRRKQISIVRAYILQRKLPTPKF